MNILQNLKALFAPKPKFPAPPMRYRLLNGQIVPASSVLASKTHTPTAQEQEAHQRHLERVQALLRDVVSLDDIKRQPCIAGMCHQHSLCKNSLCPGFPSKSKTGL